MYLYYIYIEGNMKNAAETWKKLWNVNYNINFKGLNTFGRIVFFPVFIAGAFCIVLEYPVFLFQGLCENWRRLW